MDLGTTFSVVGINVKGVVTIIDDGQGNKIFPSVVSYLEDGSKMISSNVTTSVK